MILNIKIIAEKIIDEVRIHTAKKTIQPSLTVVMVGNNSASEVYVRNKIKTCESVGIKGVLLHLPDTIPLDELL